MSDSFATPWTAACQAPLSMGFPRQEYWSGCHFLLQGIWRWNSPALAGGFLAAEPVTKILSPSLPPTRVPSLCSYMPCPFSEFPRYCLTAGDKMTLLLLLSDQLPWLSGVFKKNPESRSSADLLDLLLHP